MIFRMKNEGRALKAAKELKSLLAPEGVRLTLTLCRAAVARMYGHGSWAELTASLGGGRDPEDSDVDEATRSARHATQEAALMDIGLAPAIAREIRVRLSVTGRSARDAAKSEPFEVVSGMHYHPRAMADAAERLGRMKEDMQGRGAHWERYAGDTLSSVVAVCKDFAIAKGEVTPLDAEAFGLESLGRLQATVSSVLEAARGIVDASATPHAASDDDMDQPFSGPFDDISRYVHLGTNAYPSPFPGCGIEGVYLTLGREHEVDGSPYDDGADVEATFVVSAELVPGLPVTHATEGDTPMRELVLASRHASYRMRVHPDSTLGDLVGYPDHFVDGDFATWAPYVAAPLAAAHAALAEERDGAGVEDGLYHPETVTKAEMRKWARARTPEARDDFMEDFSDEGGLVVRFVRGVPALARDDDFPIVGAVDHPFPRLGDPMAWAEAYANMAVQAQVPEVKQHFAARALACVGPILPMVERNPGMDRNAAAVAFMALSDAMSRRAPAESVAPLRKALRLASPWTRVRILARMVALHVQSGDAGAAHEAMRKLDGVTTEVGLVAWTRALVEARFGTNRSATRMIDIAEAAAPGSAAVLLDRHDNEFMRWLKARDIGENEDAMACAIQHAAWRTVPGFPDLLHEVMAA